VRRITGELAGIAAAALGEATTVLHNARRALRRAIRSEPLTWADHARAEPRVVAFRRIPRHQWARVRAWDGRLLQRIGAGKLLSREHMEGRVVSTSTCAWALGSPSTAGVWGTCSTSAASSGQTLKIFGHGRSGGSFAFVDLEHRIGYSYVMNKFDATMAHAGPRSIALSYEVYATLGVSANSSGLPEADPWQS
jgi:CubicO group peptidase (beta-lactamase class C family)